MSAEQAAVYEAMVAKGDPMAEKFKAFCEKGVVTTASSVKTKVDSRKVCDVCNARYTGEVCPVRHGSRRVGPAMNDQRTVKCAVGVCNEHKTAQVKELFGWRCETHS